MPSSFREKTLRIAYQGHQGIVKMKELLRTKVWWPKIDNDVEILVKSCLPCQASGTATPPPPLHRTETPSQPWSHLHMNFLGPFLTGEMLFVLIDSYSKFPEIEIMKTTTAAALIPKLDRIFATHGLPTKITSDTVPPYNGSE